VEWKACSSAAGNSCWINFSIPFNIQISLASQKESANARHSLNICLVCTEMYGDSFLGQALKTVPRSNAENRRKVINFGRLKTFPGLLHQFIGLSERLWGPIQKCKKPTAV